jgi:hypothetical protein
VWINTDVHDRWTNPLFWAAHHHEILADDDHDTRELIEPIFGLEADDVTDFYMNEHVQPEGDSTPLFLPIADGHSIAVETVDRGAHGHEQRFYVTHESWPTATLVGYHSPHFALPAFRWDEVRAIAAAASRNHGPTAQSAAMLLLLPSVYFTDADDLDAAERTVRDAWKTLPHIEVRNPELAAELSVASLSADEVRWWRDPRLGWINDGKYSLRNPTSALGRTLGEDRFARIDSFLAVMGIGR